MDNTNQRNGMRMHSISPKYLKKITMIINLQDILFNVKDYAFFEHGEGFSPSDILTSASFRKRVFPLTLSSQTGGV